MIALVHAFSAILAISEALILLLSKVLPILTVTVLLVALTTFDTILSTLSGSFSKTLPNLDAIES